MNTNENNNKPQKYIFDPKRLKNLSEPAEPPKLILPGIQLMEGTITIFAAGPGVGKTWFFLDLGIRAAAGLPLYWEQNEKAKLAHWIPEHQIKNRQPIQVLHIDCESGEKEISQKKERLLNSLKEDYPDHDGIDELDYRYHYMGPGELPKFSTENPEVFSNFLRAAITEQYFDSPESNKPAKLILIDHLSALNTSEENSNNEMSQLCNTLRVIAQETNSAILVLHHTQKSTQKTKQQNADMTVIRGAGAIAANFTSGYYLERRDNNHIKVTEIKKAYHSAAYDLSFELFDVRKHNEYERKFYGKSWGIKLVSMVSADTPEMTEDLIIQLIGDGKISQNMIIDRLRAANVVFRNSKLPKILSKMVDDNKLAHEKGPRNASLYSVVGGK